MAWRLDGHFQNSPAGRRARDLTLAAVETTRPSPSPLPPQLDRSYQSSSARRRQTTSFSGPGGGVARACSSTYSSSPDRTISIYVFVPDIEIRKIPPIATEVTFSTVIRNVRVRWSCVFGLFRGGVLPRRSAARFDERWIIIIKQNNNDRFRVSRSQRQY